MPAMVRFHQQPSAQAHPARETWTHRSTAANAACLQSVQRLCVGQCIQETFSYVLWASCRNAENLRWRKIRGTELKHSISARTSAFVACGTEIPYDSIGVHDHGLGTISLDNWWSTMQVQDSTRLRLVGSKFSCLA